jgi:thiamine-phosphate pyrophosphorylase
MGRHLPRGLYGIADSGFRADMPVLDKVRAFAAAGAPVVQLRLKRESAAQALQLLREAAPICRAAGCLLVMNDRADLAHLGGADGVHLGNEDLPVAEARALLGPEMLIGATVRTLEEAHAAAQAGASYVGYGPVFGTSTKSLGVPPRGTAMLAEVVRGSPIPVVAIGGIDLARIGDVARTGAAAAAVVSAALGASDPAAAARELAARFASEARA